jgi:hypothetical protein
VPPLLLKSTPGRGAWVWFGKRGADERFCPLSADYKTKRTLNGISRHFHPFKVPTKADNGKPSMIWT